MESVFFQRIVCNGNEVPLSLLLTGAYIETMSLDSPKVILLFADRDAGIQDVLNVNEGQELTIDFGDIHTNETAGFSDTFTIISAKRKDDLTLQVEALQSHIASLKYLIAPVFFVDKTPSFILSALFPDVPTSKIHVNGVSGRGTFHVHHNVSPSAVLQQMAIEFGARLFFFRGELYFQSYDHLKSKESQFRFEHRRAGAQRELWNLKLLTSDTLLKRKLKQKAGGWSQTQGVIADHGVKAILPTDNTSTLANYNKALIPLCQFEVTGDSNLTPDTALELVFNRISDEARVNESLPESQLPITISHYQKGTTYKCLVVAGVVNDE